MSAVGATLKWFVPPRIADAERMRVARLLNILLLSALVFLCVALSIRVARVVVAAGLIVTLRRGYARRADDIINAMLMHARERHGRRIFDPFYMTKPPGEGTGLSLSLSYEVVIELEGSMDVLSTAGEGTEFVVQFPVSDKENMVSSMGELRAAVDRSAEAVP